MAKTDDFVPLIERALRAPDPKAALLQAITKIKAGELQSCALQGRSRFERFMDAALRHAESGRRRLAGEVDILVQEFMVELVTDTFEGDEQDRRTALDLIEARPRWCEE